jgi:hypothetical protein
LYAPCSQQFPSRCEAQNHEPQKKLKKKNSLYTNFLTHPFLHINRKCSCKTLIGSKLTFVTLFLLCAQTIYHVTSSILSLDIKNNRSDFIS